MKKVILFAFLLLFVQMSVSAQDTIVTVDGQTISAYILREGSTSIFLGNSQYTSQSNLKLRKREIDYIKYQNGYRRTFADSVDIRISRPYSLSGGFMVSPDNEYGNLYGAFDYFITPRINYEIHAGVTWAATGVNYYFLKPDKNRSLFPYVGLLGGYDYNGYGSDVMIIPVGVSKIYPNGLNVRIGIDGLLIFDDTDKFIMCKVMVGHRFK